MSRDELAVRGRKRDRVYKRVCFKKDTFDVTRIGTGKGKELRRATLALESCTHTGKKEYSQFLCTSSTC